MSWTTIIAFGTLTGMRSMAGLATLGMSHRSGRAILALAAAGEMVADKTDMVGDRVDPLPLLGRAVIGATVGGVIAREQRQNIMLGGAVAACTAVVVAHLACRARKGLPLSNIAGGLLEDALVLALAARYVGTRYRSG